MKILFICSANVGRSQIAQGYYNYYTKSQDGFSAALIEDRREKYEYKPTNNIIQIMKEDGIDISSQKIKLLTKDLCDNADKIILLLNPSIREKSEFKINGESPIKFLLNNYENKIKINQIKDPYGTSDNELQIIRNTIKSFILSFIMNSN